MCLACEKRQVQEDISKKAAAVRFVGYRGREGGDCPNWEHSRNVLGSR
jgi:hypothetical protein